MAPPSQDKADLDRLMRAVGEFRSAYLRKFGRTANPGVRANAPLRDEVGALSVVWNDLMLPVARRSESAHWREDRTPYLLDAGDRP